MKASEAFIKLALQHEKFAETELCARPSVERHFASILQDVSDVLRHYENGEIVREYNSNNRDDALIENLDMYLSDLIYK